MWRETLVRKWHSLNKWEQVALALWVTVLLVVCVRSAITPRKQNVMHIFSLAGQNWMQGKTMYGNVATDRDVYRYSPVVAVTYVPLAIIPERLCNPLWRIFNVVVLLWGLLWWLRVVLPRRLQRWELAALMLLMLPITIPSLNNGQTNLMMLGMMLAGVAAASDKRWTVAALLLAGATWLKGYPLSLAMLVMLLSPWRFTWRFVAFLIVGGLLPFLFQRPDYVVDAYRGWIHTLGNDGRNALDKDFWLRDVRLLFFVVCGVRLSSQAYLAIQLVVAALAAFFVVMGRWCRLPSDRQWFTLTQLCLIWQTVFGPATESATWIVLAPTLTLSLLLAWRENYSFGVKTALTTSYGLFVVSHMAKWFPWGNAFANLGPQPLAGVIYYAVALYFGVHLFWEKEPNVQVERREGPGLPVAA
ncbi:MAG: glycosyltransferase family 87 protein [Gemmataceae bacterium]